MVRDEFSISENKQFWYRPHPVASRAYQFLHWDSRQGYQPIGEYIVLDEREETRLSERKVENLITLMNGHMRLYDLRSDVGNSRMLYQIKENTDELDRKQIVFRTFTGNGVSKENAILTIDKEYWSDDAEA
jgi:hypothetical protein